MENDQRLFRHASSWPAALVDQVVALDACDGYLVVVGDPMTGDVDAYGPYTGLQATVAADHVRQDLDLLSFDDVQVNVIRLHGVGQP